MATVYTPAQVIEIAKLSQFFALQAAAKGSLFAPETNPNLSHVLYVERKSLEWAYNIDPAISTLQTTANYVYSLCGRFGGRAIATLGNGTGIIITPTNPTQSTIFPIHITSSDFTGTAYDNPDIVGYNLMLFINQLSQQWWFAGPDSFDYTATGIDITIPGFDPSTYDYDVVIQNVQNL